MEEVKDIFPELAESEDERIRQSIIADVNSRLKCCSHKMDDYYRQQIAWLEKQKGKDALIKELGEYKVKYTQKVIDGELERQKLYNNSEEDEVLK